MGNPSDGYGGRAVASEVLNVHADVVCRAVQRPASSGLLLDATRTRFERFAAEYGSDLRPGAIAMEATTTIPFQVGLAGSSAMVIAALRALQNFHGFAIPEHKQASLALAVETEGLGIHGGLMDRVSQVYGRTMYMDVSLGLLQRRGYGDYRRLPSSNLPPLFVAFRAQLGEGSGIVHGDLRRRFAAGEPLVLDTMIELGSLADRARDLIDSGNGGEIGPLMDRNLALRDRVAPISPGNRALVECGRRCGTHVKFAGSGGAVVGTYDGDPGRLAAVRSAYLEAGADFFVPEID